MPTEAANRVLSMLGVSKIQLLVVLSAGTEFFSGDTL